MSMKNTFICVYTLASQTPSGELSIIFIPGFIVSVALNILFIAVIVIMTIVFIATRRRSGIIYYAWVYEQMCACIHASTIHVFTTERVQSISTCLQSCVTTDS